MQAGILLASQAESEIQRGNTDRAVLLALAALEEYPYTPQAEHALGQAVTYNRALAPYEGHSAAVTGAAWSSDGSRIATSSTDNSVHIWEADTGKLIRQIDLPKGHHRQYLRYGHWPSNGLPTIATCSPSQAIAFHGQPGLRPLPVGSGDRAAGCSRLEVQNTTRPSTGELGTAGSAHFTTGAGAAFAKDGRLATLGGDNTALVWEPMLTGQPLTLSGHTGRRQRRGLVAGYHPPGDGQRGRHRPGMGRGNGEELLQLSRAQRRCQPGGLVAGWEPVGDSRG
jgi:WD40 repeat protein